MIVRIDHESERRACPLRWVLRTDGARRVSAKPGSLNVGEPWPAVSLSLRRFEVGLGLVASKVWPAKCQPTSIRPASQNSPAQFFLR